LTELDVVAAPMKYALGVEYPGLVLIASNQYDDPQSQTFIATIAHEVAHQWWYNLVGNDVYKEPWLDEALATYSTALYYETGVGKGAYAGYLQYLQTRYDGLVADGLDDIVTQPLMYFEGLNNPRVYGSVAYTKGALFFDALRNKIGDTAFFNALQAYFQAHIYRVATTQDLLEAFRQASDQPLDSFFQEWLYSAK
jgi:aminopeptidase N